MKKTSTKKIFAIAAVGVAAIVGIGVMTGAASNKTPAEEPAERQIIVETVSPKTEDIVVMGEYIGTVEPSRQITIYPKASGEVLSVNYNVGDTVQAGDILFELDSKALQTSISQNQAAVASAQAKAQQNLAIAQNNLATQEFNAENGYDSTLKSAQTAIDNAQAAVASAENRLQTANASLSSARRQLREFRDDDIYPVSLAAMEGMLDEDQVKNQLRDAVIQAELAVEAAELGVEQAKSGLEKAKDGYKTAQVMVDEQRISINSQVELAKLGTNFNDQYIAIQKLQNDLDNYTVTSPISGIIEQRRIDPYDMASPQTPALVISNKDAMVVSFQVSETTWKNTRPGDTVEVEKDGATWPGTVTEISTMAGTGGGLYTIKASVENAPFDLPTGSFVKVWSETQGSRGTLTIPMDTVYYDGSTPYVLIYENGLAKKAILETGISDGANIEILSGLRVGELVITTWNSAMSDGTEIVLLEDYQASLQAVEENADDGETAVSDVGDEALATDSEEQQ